MQQEDDLRGLAKVMELMRQYVLFSASFCCLLPRKAEEAQTLQTAASKASTQAALCRRGGNTHPI